MHVASVALALFSAWAAPAVACFVSSPLVLCALGMAGGVAVALRARDKRRPGEHVAAGFHVGQMTLGVGLVTLFALETTGRGQAPPLREAVVGLTGIGAGLMFGGAPHVLRYAGYVPFFSGAGTWRAFLPYGLALSALAALACWGWVLAGWNLALPAAGFGLLQWGLAWRLTRRWRRAGADERHE